MNITVALAGNPNSGKSTLFNALTGSNQFVGNWPGVTVERKEARFALEGDALLLVDLPGTYSLSPHSLEERITRGFLDEGAPDVILNVVDATNIERNLYLTLELMALGRPMVVALNLIDEVERRGEAIDCAALSRALGAPVVPISAKKRRGFDALFAAIHRQIRSPLPPRAVWAGAPDMRYRAIERILQQAGCPQILERQSKASARLDRVLTHRYLAFPIFLSIMAAIFLATFGGFGAALSQLAGEMVAILSDGAGALLRVLGAPTWARGLAVGGVFAGVGGVLAFLPQLMLLFLFLSLLEESGYMSRAAFITDRLLKRLGLSGRSFIPMLMGFGCTTTAVIAARGVENERDRRMTILLTPFMSCGAKLPVYALFGSALFPGRAALVVLSLYLLGMLMVIPAGLLLRKVAFREGQTPFVMELPDYRVPTAKNVLNRLRDRAKDFLTRAGTTIFLTTIVVWFLQSFSPGFRMVPDASLSIFGKIGAWIAPVFRPLGFGEWEQSVALLSGAVAKEAVVSTLEVLYASGSPAGLRTAVAAAFTPLSAYAYLVFVLLYMPCASAVAAIRRETSRKLALLSVGMQTGFAYIAALLVYQIGRLFAG